MTVVECSRASDGLEEEREEAMFWDEVGEFPFGVVSGRCCWI